MAVTGGLDAFNDIFMYMCFSKTPALSPTGDARPFDAQADGTVLGEGLGVLVLKRLEDARRDNDRIYAVIRSIGSSSDGKGQAVYAQARPAKPLRYRVLTDPPPSLRRRSNWLRLMGPEPGSVTGPSWRPSKRSIAAHAGRAMVRFGVGQVASGPHQGSSRRGRHDQSRIGPASQGLAADNQGQSAD